MKTTMGSIWRWIGVLAAACSLLASARAQDTPAPPSTPPSGGPVAIPAELAAQNIAILPIRGPIDRVTSMSVKRRLASAAKAGADTVIIELDTPGGEIGAVLEICDHIEQSSIPRIFAWVNTKAYSGGAIIALACDRILVNSGAAFGDALPIAMSFGMLNALPEAERQKALVPLLAQVVYSARRQGYDEYLVQALVSLGVELWLVEDPSTGARWCIDRNEFRVLFGEEPAGGRPRLVSASPPGRAGPANANRPPDPMPVPADPAAFTPASPTLNPISERVIMKADVARARPVFTAADRGKYRLVEYISDGNGPVVLRGDDLAFLGLATNAATRPDGTRVIEPNIATDADLKTYLGGKHLGRLDQSWSESMVGLLTSWPVRALLIAVFLVALFVELTHPGVALAGAIAGLALIALLTPPFLIGMANWWEIAAIIVGMVLIVLEILVIPGFGVPGLVGLVLLFGGLVGTFIPNDGGGLFPSTPQARSEAMYGLASVLLAVVTAGVTMYYLSKHFKSLPIMGRLVLRSPSGEGGEDLLSAMRPPETDQPDIGDEGVAITPLRPAGRVQIGEKIYDVVADLGFVPAGASVRVTGVSEFRISVDELPKPGGTA